MPSSKITQLPLITQINANTSNTLFVGVDVPTLSTGQLTVHTLAQGLYSNEVLNVGVKQQNLPNTVAQFSASGDSYIQTNLVNTNDGGSADIVVTANTGTDSTYFIDMGYANKNFQPGQEFNNIGNAVNPLDGYIYAQGQNSTVPGGNLIVGSTTSGREVRFVAGGGSSSNVIAKMTANGFYMMNGMPFYFADGTVLSSANTTTLTAAFNLANTAVQNTATININNLNISGNTIAQSMNTANLIVNGTGNITGTLNVSGIVNMNAQVVITNTTFPSTQSAMTISATANVQTPSQAGTLLHLSSKANTAGRFIIDSFGVNQNTAYSLIAGRSARGTVDAPTASQTGDILMRLSGNGYGTTGFAPLGVGRIDIVAAENFTDTARGSQIIFYNNVTGSNTPIQIATFNALDAQFYGYVNPQKGFVYTPLVYPSAQTAITIDFANNSLVRAQTATGLTVTLSNLLAGKEVVAWITNTAGTNQTFTHGLSATNSTTNSTSYNIPGTSTILVRYMSIDGTTQNTFVAVTHA
jgi:hypothetical protein